MSKKNGSGQLSVVSGEALLEVLGPPQQGHVDAIDTLERELLNDMVRDHVVLCGKFLQIRNYGEAIKELDKAKAVINQLAVLLEREQGI